MIYTLDKNCSGTANDDTLLYGVEVKFYNMEVELNDNLECKYDGLYYRRRVVLHIHFHMLQPVVCMLQDIYM